MTSSTDADPGDLPTFAHVLAAADRLKGHAVLTPLLESSAINKRLGFRLLVKAEPLQRTGSFKFRGAFNRLVQLDEAARKRGVVAFSSGNHAQGVAAAAEMLGMPATIVMPADAPAIKLANTRGYGATVVTYDRHTEDREAITARIAEAQGATIVRPYDEREIMAGQGTAGLEIIEQAAARGITIDAMAANSSGGGLIAGCALAFAARSPATRLYCAEPAGFDDHARSLVAGTRLRNVAGAYSICDALLGAIPGQLTFEINRRHLAGGLVASDTEAKRAMAVAFNDLKLVIEPGGAIALAAALEGRFPGNPRTIAVIASGGNVDAAVFREALAA
ncbi:MAG TPA: threonine/serine dehydratase [Aliidongia sp.]|uniref:threonine ammonia-lyase n=1 Tax=Aliidongia sp. TaxID=1914230 RepID=UPI002DDD9E29|nr:threonine/serine dehydratase [Aliidongia sp.]HEV2674613.1 threonine/serine dehydratase [Aliidongia sp.]